MVNLTEKERIDVLIMVGYGDRKRTQVEVVALFNEVYPNRPPISQSSVSKIIKKYSDTGSVKDKPRSGRLKSVTESDAALNVLLAIEENPRQSREDLARDYDISVRSVGRILRKEKFHPFKIHLTQELTEDDFDRRIEFSETMRGIWEQNPNFVNQILFSDEATFTLHGHVNRHNCRYWAQHNPHWMMQVHTQRPQKLNVWMGIVGDAFIGPFFIEGNLTSEKYLDLLRDSVLPALQNLYGDYQHVWFQQDGAPPHFGLQVRLFLNNVFPHRWIGRRGEIEWPARSPDMNPCDFFLWGHLKNEVYKERPNNLGALRDRILGTVRAVRQETFGNVRREFLERLNLCLVNNGRHFEHLL